MGRGRTREMKIGICDECKDVKEQIRGYLQTIYAEELEYIYKFYTPAEIVLDIEEMTFECEILIMETEYPESGMNGVELAKQINEAFPACKIIYLTANENAIKDVYETNHCYFVRKKDAMQVLNHAIQKAITMVKKDTDQKSLEIICEGHHVFINKSDIIYIEKVGRTIKFVTYYREYSCYDSLSSIQKFFGDNVVRVHGGYAVNLAYITYLGVDRLEVRNGKVIPIGRTYDKEVRKAYQEYWKK